MINKRQKGEFFEKLACDHLSAMGCSILYKNYKNKSGEIDIIAKDGRFTCFIEVKFRKDNSFGGPEAAVNIAKQRQICKVSKFFLYSHKISFDSPIRYDVIAISGGEEGYSVHWIKNAFDFIA